MLTDIGGGWYLAKIARGLPPLKRTKLSKKAQERQDYIQNKLYEANRWWNNWKSQLRWIKLEWVDPIPPALLRPRSEESVMWGLIYDQPIQACSNAI